MDEHWIALAGPLWTEEQMVRELGADAVALEVGVRWQRILRLTTEDGRQLYPAWQVRDGVMVDGLHPVLETLYTGTDDSWTWALWLTSVVPARDGGDGIRRQIDDLVAGDLRRILDRAAWMAAGWAQ